MELSHHISTGIMAHNHGIVFVSYLVALAGSYLSLSIAERLSASKDQAILRNLSIVGSVVFGSSIWSMHFIGMLAHRIDIRVTYSPFITMTSMLIAIVCALGVFTLIRRGEPKPIFIALYSIVTGIGIAAMHYTGIFAMQMDATVTFKLPIFILSIAIAIGASYVALLLFFKLPKVYNKQNKFFLKTIASILMALAICGLHYTGMFAMVITPLANAEYIKDQHFYNMLISVAVVVTFVLGGSFYIMTRVQKEQARLFNALGNAYQTYLPPALILVAGFFLSSYTHELMDKDDIIHTKEIAHQSSADLKTTILGELQKTRAIEAFYKNSKYVSFEEFQNYMHDFYGDNRINYAQYFLPDKKEDYKLEFKFQVNESRQPLTANDLEQLYNNLLKEANPSRKVKNKHDVFSLRNMPPTPEKFSNEDIVFSYHQNTTQQEDGKNPSGHVILFLNTQELYKNFLSDNTESTILQKITSQPISTYKTENKKTDAQAINTSFDISNVRWEIEATLSYKNHEHSTYKDISQATFYFATILLAFYIMRLSKQRQREKTIRKLIETARDEANHANAAKSDFLANMSHEIRSPMSGILGASQMFAKTNLNPEQRGWLSIIQKSGDALMAIINDILDFSKIEAGKLFIENKEFDLFQLVHDTTEIFSGRTQEKRLEIIINIANDVPKHLTQDELRIRQVLINLLSNAIKFTKEGHILVSLFVSKDNTTGARFINIAVSDTGIGIATEKLDYIFEKFSQAEESTTRRFGGTGLGLAISHKLCSLMGGSLSVASLENEGSTFRAQLPFENNTARPSPITASRRLERKKIAVIEPYQLTLTTIENTLKTAGCDVFTYTDIDAFFAEAQKNLDFILFDYTDTDEAINTPQNTERLNQYAKDGTHLLMMAQITSLSSNTSIDNFICSGSIKKPVMPEHILHAMHYILDAKDKAEQNIYVTQALVEGMAYEDTTTASLNYMKDVFVGKKILVVEDMKVNQIIMKKILGDIGCITDFVNDGGQAVHACSDTFYDLIFMDCQMPNMDGFEATAIIREQGRFSEKQPVIIALTADALTGDREKCISVGMDDYLNKPFKTEQIYQALYKWLITRKRT